MMYATDPLVVQYQGFVTDLTTVEKRSIVGLTEIARDALRTHPHLAPSLANVITTRIVQAPVDFKLPVLYLLDSITKNIGEPYKSCFAASLPEIYMNAWKFGGPGLRRPLEKLLATWTGVFPYPVLDEIRAAMATTPAAYGLTTVSNGHPVYAAPAGGAAGRKPMTLDPRLSGAYAHSLGSHPAYPPPAAGMYDQGQGFVGYPAHVSTSGYEVQPANHPLPMQPLQGPQSTANLPDLLALLSSGPLTSAGVQPTVPDVGTIRQLKGKSRMSTTVFSNENIKEPNPAAVDRLLSVTERTRGNFLDKKFFRRQKLSNGLRASRLWYVDLDTWMAGTTSASPPDGATRSGATNIDTVAPPDSAASHATVAADEEQTHCALSGEKFDLYWDEDHQEWRYRDAKRLNADEAVQYGLSEGALVLVSALSGAPTVVAARPKAEGPKEEGAKKEGHASEDGFTAGDEPAPKRLKIES